jgi:hypothetical protein
MSYLGIPPYGQTIRSVTNITATASQTTFSIVGGYQIGYVDVFLNGVLLVPNTDYTATDGLTVVLTSAAAADDAFQALSYQPVAIADVYTTTQTNTLLDAKQATLVSGTNIKTVNSTSLLGSGDIEISGGATGAGGDKVFWENDQTVDTDYTITSNKNAMSAGPITISTGITVTIPSGSVWTIV